MKKLSLLIALCMLISIGGVYADWLYLTDTGAGSATAEQTLSLTGSSTVAAGVGSFTVDTSSLVLNVDPAGNTFNTTLVGTGNLVIKFTPHPNSMVDVKTNGIDAKLEATTTLENFDDGHGLGSRKILTFKGTGAHAIRQADVTPGEHELKWTLNSDGTLQVTISAQELIAHHLDFGTFTLDTMYLYNQFSTALAGGKVHFTVSVP